MIVLFMYVRFDAVSKTVCIPQNSENAEATRVMCLGCGHRVVSLLKVVWEIMGVMEASRTPQNN